MKITKVEEEGIKLALCLARREGRISLPELAECEGLSEALVAKVMAKLRKGGVVYASRGRFGGYSLVRPPAETSVSDVLGALDRPILEGCYNSGKETATPPCPHVSDCGLRPVWNRLREEMNRVLSQVTLSDLIMEETAVEGRLAKL